MREVEKSAEECIATANEQEAIYEELDLEYCEMNPPCSVPPAKSAVANHTRKDRCGPQQKKATSSRIQQPSTVGEECYVVSHPTMHT